MMLKNVSYILNGLCEKAVDLTRSFSPLAT